MLFWKKKHDNLIVQCSLCEWSPDGGKHWACSCGHVWNTFDTKAKCPKCGTKWEKTWCPGCGKSSPHKDWYKTKEEIDQIRNSADQKLLAKKASLESRLIAYGMTTRRISHLQYLDHSMERFQIPYDAGCRMIILSVISHLAYNLDERSDYINWLKSENLWSKVSPVEQNFLLTPSPDEDLVIDLSWRIEGALTLGWCVNLINVLPGLDNSNNSKVIELFYQQIPDVGNPVSPFLENLNYRSLEEIYEENLLNEMATGYFRDLIFNGKPDTTNIDRFISYERHRVLNWLRTYVEGEYEVTGIVWDETDTST